MHSPPLTVILIYHFVDLSFSSCTIIRLFFFSFENCIQQVYIISQCILLITIKKDFTNYRQIIAYCLQGDFGKNRFSLISSPTSSVPISGLKAHFQETFAGLVKNMAIYVELTSNIHMKPPYLWLIFALLEERQSCRPHYFHI